MILSFNRCMLRLSNSWLIWQLTQPAELDGTEYQSMGNPLRMIGRLLVGLTWIYCIGIVALALLWLSGFQGIWWLNLANVFALCLFTPLLLLVPVSWLMPVPRLHGVVALAVVAFFGLFGARFIPPAAQITGGTPLRVVTFNLHNGLDPAQLADQITAMRDQHADVIALQELSAPAAGVIQRELIHEYPFQALAPSASLSGMGVISRYALEVLPPPQLTAQLTLVRVGRVDVTLINASLASPALKRQRLPVLHWAKRFSDYHTNRRSRDVEQLLQVIDQVRGPLVIAGDFNLSDREADYAQFAVRLHDAYRETNWGFGHTYPSSLRIAGLRIMLPLARIDYIWSTGGVVPVATKVACGDASDHCMVIADVQFGNTSAPSLKQGFAYFPI
jgi:vancomycin resistance protein VanJ